MAGKCEWVKDNCLKNLQVKKKELEKYVDKHAAKMTSILSDIEKEETNIKLFKAKIIENEKKINGLEEENEQLSFKSEQSTFMLSNLQAEKIDLEKIVIRRYSSYKQKLDLLNCNYPRFQGENIFP